MKYIKQNIQIKLEKLISIMIPHPLLETSEIDIIGFINTI